MKLFAIQYLTAAAFVAFACGASAQITGGSGSDGSSGGGTLDLSGLGLGSLTKEVESALSNPTQLTGLVQGLAGKLTSEVGGAAGGSSSQRRDLSLHSLEQRIGQINSGVQHSPMGEVKKQLCGLQSTVQNLTGQKMSQSGQDTVTTLQKILGLCCQDQNDNSDSTSGNSGNDSESSPDSSNDGSNDPNGSNDNGNGDPNSANGSSDGNDNGNGSGNGSSDSSSSDNGSGKSSSQMKTRQTDTTPPAGAAADSKTGTGQPAGGQAAGGMAGGKADAGTGGQTDPTKQKADTKKPKKSKKHKNHKKPKHHKNPPPTSKESMEERDTPVDGVDDTANDATEGLTPLAGSAYKALGGIVRRRKSEQAE